jgi:hypothetical protein
LEDDPLSLLGAGAEGAGVEAGPDVEGVAGADDPSAVDEPALSALAPEDSELSGFDVEESSLAGFEAPFLRLSFL